MLGGCCLRKKEDIKSIHQIHSIYNSQAKQTTDWTNRLIGDQSLKPPRARSASVVAPQGFSMRAFRSRRRKKHLELLGWIAMGHRTLPRWQCTNAVLLWLLLSVPTAAAASLPLQGSRPDASANLEWLRVGTWFPALSSNLFRARSHSATMITAIASIGSTGAGETQQQQRQQHPRRSPAIDARDCTHSGALGAATDACVLGADAQCRAVSSGPGTASANLLPGTSLPPAPNLLLDIELPVSGLNLLRARSTCCEHDADSSKSTDQDPRSIDECTIDGSNGPGNLVCVCVFLRAHTRPVSHTHSLTHTKLMLIWHDSVRPLLAGFPRDAGKFASHVPPVCMDDYCSCCELHREEEYFHEDRHCYKARAPLWVCCCCVLGIHAVHQSALDDECHIGDVYRPSLCRRCCGYSPTVRFGISWHARSSA